MDKVNFNDDEEKDIVEHNKYLNKKFDISEILALGNIPEFENAADRFICAAQVAFFVRKNGLGNVDNLIKYLSVIPTECRVIFLKQQTIQTLELMLNNPKFAPMVEEILKVVK